MLYKSKIRGSFGRYYPISLVIVYILSVIEFIIRMNLFNRCWDSRPQPFQLIRCLVFSGGPARGALESMSSRQT